MCIEQMGCIVDQPIRSTLCKIAMCPERGDPFMGASDSCGFAMVLHGWCRHCDTLPVLQPMIDHPSHPPPHLVGGTLSSRCDVRYFCRPQSYTPTDGTRVYRTLTELRCALRRRRVHPTGRKVLFRGQELMNT